MEDTTSKTDTVGQDKTQQTSSKPAETRFAPPVGRARFRLRHFFLVAFFLLWVVAPVGIAAVYLYTVASDQYASHIGFSVRKEENGSAIELLGGITELSGSSSSDTDILYEYIQSQKIVRIIDEKLNLKNIYSNPDDPIFGLGDDLRIEALLRYWRKMVRVFYDNSSGLIEVRVLAFNPLDAQKVAEALFEESSLMINKLSAIARDDATIYAQEELLNSVARLKTARQVMTSFQTRTQIVDPSADLQGQMGVLNSLQTELAATKIELELLLDNSAQNDPRVLQQSRKIAAIQGLIKDERNGFGGGEDGSLETFSQQLSEFQGLLVDVEFAEKSYLASQAVYDGAIAEARRKSRYLAMHIEPTLAETGEYPQRILLLIMLLGFLSISWAILVMVYYSLRDRR